jgi:hypothetical protein
MRGNALVLGPFNKYGSGIGFALRYQIVRDFVWHHIGAMHLRFRYVQLLLFMG